MGWSKFENTNYTRYKNMFVDREEIIDLFKQEYHKLKEEPDYFKVISIYGIGGIGKSYLIEHLLQIPKEDKINSKIITINMDIMHSADIFDNLVKMRKQIGVSCLYFDYALILLWDVYKIEKLDESFMTIIKGNFLDILNITESGISAIIPTLGLENIQSLYRNNILPRIKEHIMQPNVLKEITDRFQKDPQQLYEFMPHLLGLDLAQIAHKHKLIAFFDSYERYLIDHDDWLKELIGSANQGLFLVASREKLNWSNDENRLYPYKLMELPESQAKLILKASLYPKHYDLIDTIIKKTQCVPIFIEIAINIYKKIVELDSEEIYSEFWMIKYKSDFIKRFLHHLPNNEQEIVMILSVIKIFNADIFEWIVHDLNLNYSVLKYHDICKLCLINLLKEDDKFLKLHDVFTANALLFIETEKKQRILHSYITYIGNRGLAILSQKQISILFRKLLLLSEFIDFSIYEIEYLCDIFFVLYESNCSPELYDLVKKTKSSSITAFQTFVDIIYIEKKDAQKSFDMCISFDKYFLLGKHIKSFELIKFYSQAISGNYQDFAIVTKKMYSQLIASDVLCWYYGKTKIYYGDNLMLHGRFMSALDVFEEYAQELSKFPRKNGDYFEVRKQSAHCKRFNMLLTEASNIYTTLADEYVNKKGLLVYVLTNLCETNCYFKPEIVFEIAPKALQLCEYLKRPKETAKIYYALAIANLHDKNYELVNLYITKSITLNQEAHYPSGVLFALMAQAYLDYAQTNTVSDSTLFKIKTLMQKGLVYQFFELPLCIMVKKTDTLSQIESKYEWIDFSYSVEQYKKFLYLITEIRS